MVICMKRVSENSLIENLCRKVWRMVSYFIWITFLTAICACSDKEKDETLSIEDREITFIFEPDAWGDFGYNDLIYTGMLSYEKNMPSNVKLKYYSPQDFGEVDDLIADWKEDTTKSKKRLLVFPGSAYVEIVKDEFEDFPLDTLKDNILLFESDEIDIKGVHTFNVSSYGVSYVTGKIVSYICDSSALVVFANSSDTLLFEFVMNGFLDGLESEGKNGFTAYQYFLSDSFTGYAMEDTVYKMMHTWVKDYQFVFPVIGGSIVGMYRYMREVGDDATFFTVGIDAIQDVFTTFSIGNLRKRMDKITELYLTEWTNGEALPKSAIYGMQQGYTDWVLNSKFLKYIGLEVDDATYLNEIKAEAMVKEIEYENDRLNSKSK